MDQYRIDELIGTKIRALYQRKKGRDLFDLYCAMESGKLTIDTAIGCYKKYISSSDGEIPTARVYFLNLMEKMDDPIFLEDISPILSPDIDYDIVRAFNMVKEILIPGM
jgi:hypothetical protein